MTVAKSELLKQLRVDRSGAKPIGSATPQRRWAGWSVAGLLVVGSALAWFYLPSTQAVPVKAVVVKQVTASGASAPAGGVVVEATGYVVARREATLAPKVAGRLDQLFIEEGSRVVAGAVVAKLDDSNVLAALRQAQGGVRLAEAMLEQSRLALANGLPQYQREQEQAAAGFISAQALQTRKSEYDGLRAAVLVSEGNLEVSKGALAVAERNLDDTVVRAPFSGVVTSRAAQAGEIVSPISSGGGTIRTGIATLVDMDSLEVEVDVNQNFIHKLRVGQPATIRLDAYPDWKIAGQVVAIVPTASRSKGTVKVRLGFKDKDARILPEMGAHVAFISDRAPERADASGGVPRVVVPADSVQSGMDGGSAFVYVVVGSKINRRDVVLGSREGDGQVIVSGLSAGDRVALSGFDKLREGVSVNASDI
jgi:RND family efflux transporter MFP subunit